MRKITVVLIVIFVAFASACKETTQEPPKPPNFKIDIYRTDTTDDVVITYIRYSVNDYRWTINCEGLEVDNLIAEHEFALQQLKEIREKLHAKNAEQFKPLSKDY